MDLAELTCFIHNCKKYNKRIDYIEIDNTSNATRYFDNILIKAHLNIHLNIYDISARQDQRNFIIRRINEEINGYSRYIKFECSDELESIIKKQIIYNNLIRYSNVKEIKLYHKGELVEINFLNDLRHKIEKKQKIGLKNEIKKSLEKDEEFKRYVFYENYSELLSNKNYRKLNEALKKLNKIEEIIKKNKNSYILSKLTGGELKTSDVKNYPELIKTMDELTKIKLLVS